MARIPNLLIASALLLPQAGLALAAETAPGEHRLSPEQVEQILEEAARKNGQGPAPAELAEPAPEEVRQPIHGEVGFSIGTGGYRSAFGSAMVPLAGDGFAILSFETDRFRERELVHARPEAR